MNSISIKKVLEKFGINNYRSANNKFNELKDQFIEMGQLKSDFDIEKFTVMAKGKFLAHQFHMLMRQYVLAQSEMRRMLVDQEKINRLIIEYKEKGDKKVTINNEETYADLYVMELENQLDLLEVTMVNKIMMCMRFEEMRVELIKKNNGVVPTNEQYQEEEPAFWEWNLLNKAHNQIRQATTGIQEGIWDAVVQAQEPAVVNDKFQIHLIDEKGNLNLNRLLEIEAGAKSSTCKPCELSENSAQ